jgi:hypothetical protein
LPAAPQFAGQGEQGRGALLDLPGAELYLDFCPAPVAVERIAKLAAADCTA